jgi:hypothetical protein
MDSFAVFANASVVRRFDSNICMSRLSGYSKIRNFTYGDIADPFRGELLAMPAGEIFCVYLSKNSSGIIECAPDATDGRDTLPGLFGHSLLSLRILEVPVECVGILVRIHLSGSMETLCQSSAILLWVLEWWERLIVERSISQDGVSGHDNDVESRS